MTIEDRCLLNIYRQEQIQLFLKELSNRGEKRGDVRRICPHVFIVKKVYGVRTPGSPTLPPGSAIDGRTLMQV